MFRVWEGTRKRSREKRKKKDNLANLFFKTSNSTSTKVAMGILNLSMNEQNKESFSASGVSCSQDFLLGEH